MRGPLLDRCFDNHIKNQCKKLLNGADIYRLHFKFIVQQSRTIPSLISWPGGFNYLCHSKILFTV